MSPYRSFSEFTGVTTNVSRTGILLRAEQLPPDHRPPAIGNSARIVMEIPRSPSFSAKFLDCETTVVRVGGPQEGYQEFGFRVRRMQFRDPQALTQTPLPAGGNVSFGFAH